MPAAWALASPLAISTAILQRLPQRQALARDELTQGLALDQLHGDEVNAVIGADFVNADNVRVIYRGCDASFAQQSRPPLWVGGVLRWKDLERHPPAELRVVGTVHSPHAAFAQLLLNLVMGHPLPAGLPGCPSGGRSPPGPSLPSSGPVEHAVRRRLRQQGFHLAPQVFIPGAGQRQEMPPVPPARVPPPPGRSPRRVSSGLDP